MRNFTTPRGGRNLCDSAAKRPAPPQTCIFAKLKRGDTCRGKEKAGNRHCAACKDADFRHPSRLPNKKSFAKKLDFRLGNLSAKVGFPAFSFDTILRKDVKQ